MQRAGVRTFQNLIVGAGPAGVAVACTLLDGGSSPTLWMDPAFQSGRLANYTEVPSNTKVSLFVKYAATPASISGCSSAITAPFEVDSCRPFSPPGIRNCFHTCTVCSAACDDFTQPFNSLRYILSC